MKSNRKENCEQTPECQAFALAEAANCINQCLSEECYKEVYEKEPLEDGEIDRKREGMFTKCLRRLEREKVKANRYVK